MSSDPSTLFERVGSSFAKLSSAAKDLNSVSDELGRAISAIDLVLQRLNIGVPTWVPVVGGEDPWNGMAYWSRDIGYAKISGRWGIALCSRHGDHSSPDEETSEAWLFNDAPRWQRVEAVEKIPDLLEQLIKETEDTTKRLKSKIDRAKQLADALEQAERPRKSPPDKEAAVEYIERTYGKNKGTAPQQPAVSVQQRSTLQKGPDRAKKSNAAGNSTVAIPTIRTDK